MPRKTFNVQLKWKKVLLKCKGLQGYKKCFFQKIAFYRTFVIQINIHVYNLHS